MARQVYYKQKKEVKNMKFEENPKRCYMCQTIFSKTVKPIPVIGGSSAAGYVCSTCYVKLFGASKRGKNNETKLN